MFIQKHRFRKMLTVVLLFCLVCSCFLTFGRTSAYITDSSNTCYNTFSGETVTEPTTVPSQETTTQQSENSTVYVDQSLISPPTGAPDIQILLGLVCTLAIGIMLSFTRGLKKKDR